MKVLVNKEHIFEGKFPTFKAGSNIKIIDKCEGFYAWYSCVIDTYETYIHEDFFSNEKLIKDYNPTELSASYGDILEVLEIKNNWIYCKTENGSYGWIPSDNVKTI